MSATSIKAGLILPDIALRAEFAAAIREQLPSIELAVLDPLGEQDVPHAAEELDALFSFGQFVNDGIFQPGKAPRWVQSLGTGVDGLADRIDAGSTLLTSARGVHSACVSETAMALMLALARDLPGLLLAQRERRWMMGPANLLYGKTVGIVGVGIIAEALARRCAAFDMRVEGVSGRDIAPGFERMHGYADLANAVAGFDYLVLLAPLSDQTRNIVDAHVFARMKPGSFLINVARGGLIDEDALIAALAQGKPTAAALDVFAVEPLPADSPLWTVPNLLISPHAAGQHKDYADHVMPIVSHNFAAWCAGRIDDMINRIDIAQD
jgi:D-2-hydroxyacid dehydrogenase (NADP+)